MNGKLTISVRDEHTVITLEDDSSSTDFVIIEVSHNNLVRALARLSMVECEFEVHHLERVGLTMEMDTLEFEVETTNEDEARRKALEVCPEGWIPDRYFGSKSSFFNREGKQYARTTIRRWK